MPVFYECQRCTACCRWPGDVRVADEEIERISAYLRLASSEFIERFTKLRRDRQGLSLIEKPNGECAFLDGNLCSIQSVKPQQCRDFPNLWRFPDFQSKCRATPLELDHEEYVKRVVSATGRSENYVRAHPNSH